MLTVKNKVQENQQIKQLAWDVKELSALNDAGRSLITEIEMLVSKMSDPMYDAVEDNLARKLTSTREKLVSFVRGVTKFKRTAATHILVVMISTEDRKQKPYAIPIQCLPYKGLKDMEVRDLIDKIIKEMVDRNMKVAGKLLV